MNLGLQDKYALVTGASQGLGETIARQLAAEGAKVCMVARNGSTLEGLWQIIGGSERGHFYCALDLTQPGNIDSLYEEISGKFGRLDIMVHNVGGTLGIREPLSTAAEFQAVWYFNLGVAVELNRLFIPAMKQNGWGRIVHVSSSSAVMADASLAYSSAKAAVNTYVKGLGREMAPYGIIVTGIMPGPFRAKGGHWDNIAISNPERYEKFAAERMAVKRLGDPDEIANMITFLCSTQASYMPGSIVSVDGGIR